MNTPKYDARFPAFRGSSTLKALVQEYADRHHITFTEALRVTIAKGLTAEAQSHIRIIPIVGTVDKNDTIHEFAKAA